MSPFILAVSLGSLSALRAAASPAWVARSSSAKPKRLLLIAGALEMLRDKMPSAGDRTRLPSLIGRATSGAVSAVYANREKRPEVSRAALAATGTLSAVAATYAAFHGRRWLGKRLGIRDSFVGVAEDALSLGIRSVLSRTEKF